MRNIFKKLDNFYDNHKWFRILFTIFEYVIMFVIIFLSLIALIKLIKKPVIYSNDYDLSNDNPISMVQPLQTENDIVNLASPDLEGKEYLGDGWYKVFSLVDFVFSYNVYSGYWRFDGDIFTPSVKLMDWENDGQGYILSYEYVSGYRNITSNFKGLSFGGYAPTIDFTKDKDYIISSERSNLYLHTPGAVYENFIFKIQLEKGDTVTSYQTPLISLKQHIQLEIERSLDGGYDEGYYDGQNEGYNKGLDDGLKTVFDNQNLILNAEFLARGATAPDDRFFGYKIKLENDFYFSNIDIFGLNQFALADLDLTSNVGNVKQGIRLYGKNGVNKTYWFKDFQDNYNLSTTIVGNLNSETKYDTIIIVLATNNSRMPEHEFNQLQEGIYSKIGVYLNNMVLSSEAMEHYFNQYYNEGYYDAKDEQSNLIEQAYAKGKSEGYDEGLNANPNNHWSDLLFTIFGAFGTILAIEILPGWSIGIIIGIPIVFGIIYFIIGRKKD